MQPNLGEHDRMEDLKDLLGSNYEENMMLPEMNNMVSKLSKVSVDNKD